MDYGYVIKKSDDWYIVLVDLDDFNSGYGVVSRSVDPGNMYDINDVIAWCEANPDKVFAEHPLTHKMDLLAEREELTDWLKDHDYIGTKIATGRATISEYADEIAEMTTKSARINAIDAELKSL